MYGGIMKLSSDLIPGFTSSAHLAMIEEFAKTLPLNANVLEVGGAFGRSTFSWLNGLSNEASLTIIDAFMIDKNSILKMKTDENEIRSKFQDVIYNMYDFFGQEKTWKYVVSNHKKNHIIKNVYPFKTEEYASKNYSGVYDCVYLDGDHYYETLKLELEFFKNSTIICGDDYFTLRWSEVKQAVDEYCQTYNKKIELYEKENFYIIYNR